jgi:hypothetical protein
MVGGRLNPNPPADQQVRIEMCRMHMKNYESMKPFLESSTPEEKLTMLTKTSLFKLNKRVKKLQDKEREKDAQASIVRCPVFKCTYFCHRQSDLEGHYNAKHKDLVELGLSLAPG